MKVSFSRLANLVFIDSLPCGSVFVTMRNSARDEIGVYMVVDRSSGLTPNIKDKILTVNVQTGQLRAFDKCAKVEPKQNVVLEL